MKLFRIAAIAASLILGSSLVSCVKLQPSEIKNDQRPFTATVTVAVKFSGAPVFAGTPVVFTVTDKEFNKTYTVTRTVGNDGNAILTQGCGSQGLSVNAECQYVVGPKSYFGYTSATLNASNAYTQSVNITL